MNDTERDSLQQISEEEVMSSKDKKAPKPQKKKKTTGKEGHSARRIIIGVILILLAVALAVVVIPKMGNNKESYTVVYVKADIKEGTAITETNVGTYFGTTTISDRDTAARVINGGNATQYLVGQYAARDLYAGQAHFVQPSDITKLYVMKSDKVPEGKELVGMSIPSIHGDVGYMPKKGDIIRFYGLTEVNEDAEQPIVVVQSNGKLVDAYGNRAGVYEFLQYIEIYKVLDGNGADTSITNTLPTNMVIICTTEQVAQLVEAQTAGSIYLSLMSSGDAERAEGFLKQQDRVIKEFRARQTLAEEIEKEPVLLPLSTLDHDYTDFPVIGSTVRFGVMNISTVKQVNDKGEVVEIENMTLDVPPVLEYVRVSDVYSGKSSVSALTAQGIGALFTASNTSISVDFAPVQLEAFQELQKTGKVILLPVYDTGDALAEGYAKNDEAVRKAMIEKMVEDMDAEEEAQRKAQEEAEAKAEAEANADKKEG